MPRDRPLEPTPYNYGNLRNSYCEHLARARYPLRSSVNAAGVSPSPRAATEAFVDSVPNTASQRVLLVGEPGIGKSTLVDAAAARFEASGALVLRASPSFAERHTAFSMLWDLLGDLDWNETADVPEHYRSILEVALGRTRTTTELPALATAIALENILGELSVSTPVVLIIDDLQWSDPESRAAVERATRRLTGTRVSLVATSREYGTHLDGQLDFRFDPANIRILDGLTVDELETLTRPSWPSTLTRAQVVALHEHTGGNPMWALELIGRGVIGDLGALPVGTLHAPPSLAAVVADRLRTLSSDAADVVSIVALLGRPELALLTEVLRFSGTPSTAINEAETAGFLVLTTRSARTRHPLHASAATARLAPARRRELQTIIARAISDPVVHAQHLQQSEPPGPDETIAEALAQAAVAMRQRGARLRSAHFDAQAVERTDPVSPYYQERLLNQAQQLFSAGDQAACLRALDRVSTDRLDLVQFDSYLALSTSCLASGARPAAVLDFLRTQDDDSALDAPRRAMVSANRVAYSSVTVSDRARLSAAAFDKLSEVRAPNAIHHALRGLIRAQIDDGGGLDSARISEMDRRQSIQIVVGLDDTGLATAAYSAHLIDDVARSRSALASLVNWAREEGKEGVEKTFLAYSAYVELVGGSLPDARSFAQQSGYSALSPALPAELRYPTGLLLISEGRYSDLEHLIDAWGSSAASGQHTTLELNALRGLSAVAQGTWNDAANHLRAAAEAADSLELVEPGSRLRVDLPLIEALLQTAQVSEAGQRLAQMRAFLARHRRPISELDLHRVTSVYLAAQRDLPGALASATTAVELSAASHRPADEARARLQRARVLHRLRRVALARVDLDDAQALATVAGVHDLARQVDAARASARKSRSMSELTTAELGVLALVKTGQSNKEIAARLFISVRTVESHVAAILRKTGASGRSKLISRE
jgi:DNA-binding CsgD family transcriptional regulator